MEFKNITYLGEEISDQKILKKLPMELSEFYRKQNGLIAYSGGVHIRGCVETPEWHSLRNYWIGNNAFYKTYDKIKKSDIPFAQDCYGNQFLYRKGSISKLYTETGDIEEIATSFNDFINEIIEEPDDYLWLYDFNNFLNEGGEIKPGQLVSVYPPFCSEKSSSLSLTPISLEERLSFLANLYIQINNLPNGSKIKFTVK